MPRFLFPLVVCLTACTTGSKPPAVEEPQEPQLRVEVLEKIQPNHVRGLYMVDDEMAWASGAGGTFMKFSNGGWSADTISGYTHLDFRDVHAFNAETAILMAAGNEGRMLRTEDGGTSWVEVYTNLDSGIFLDGIDFFENKGVCYGDPMDGSMIILKSDDQGRTWTEVDPDARVQSMPKEAGFAASGTGVIVSENHGWIATGGDSIARVLTENDGTWTAYNAPMRSAEGCGIFSMTHIPPSKLVAVGGCYLDSTSSEGNCAVSIDNGKTWTEVTENGPRGYRSCVAYSNAMDLLVACGRTGIDISRDQGKTWEALSDEGFYTCALGDSTGWLMGRRGKVAKLTLAH